MFPRKIISTQYIVVVPCLSRDFVISSIRYQIEFIVQSSLFPYYSRLKCFIMIFSRNKKHAIQRCPLPLRHTSHNFVFFCQLLPNAFRFLVSQYFCRILFCFYSIWNFKKQRNGIHLCKLDFHLLQTFL